MNFVIVMIIGAIVIATTATVASSIAGRKAAERQQRSFNDDRVVAEVRIKVTSTVAWIWATVCTSLFGGGAVLYKIGDIVGALCS